MTKISSAKLLSPEELDRVIEMAWQDRTPLEAITFQFALDESSIIKLMRQLLKASSFKLWRKRVHSGVSQKHAKKETQILIGLNAAGSGVSPTIKSLKDEF